MTSDQAATIRGLFWWARNERRERDYGWRGRHAFLLAYVAYLRTGAWQD